MEEPDWFKSFRADILGVIRSLEEHDPAPGTAEHKLLQSFKAAEASYAATREAERQK